MTSRSRERLRYPLILLIVLTVIGVVLGIKPNHRDDWALENALAVAAVLVLVFTHKRFPFSKISYTLLFVYLIFHEIGAHYTYSETPYDEWFAAIFGRGLNDMLGWERNHYDRFIHFAYGLLIAYPMREVFVRIAGARGFWGYWLPLEMVMSTSMVYEIIEWCAALVVGSDLGNAYLGTQGDEWDAQKDMLLATLGAAIALGIAATIHRSLDRDFQSEWAESLRVRKKTPLGEEAVARLQAQQKR